MRFPCTALYVNNKNNNNNNNNNNSENLEFPVGNEFIHVLLELSDVSFPDAKLRNAAKSVLIGFFVVIRNLTKFVVVENDDLIPRLESLVLVRRDAIP